jgi:AcrR family transcriptional regulator
MASRQKRVKKTAATQTDSDFFRRLDERMRKGDRRKLEIIQAALRSVAKRGIHGTTYEAIASEMKIGRSRVSYHFPSFEAIIDTMMRYVTETAQAVTRDRIDAAESPRAKVEAYVRAFFEWTKRFPDQASALILFHHLSVYSASYRALHTTMRAAGLERITGLLRAAGLSPKQARERGLLVQNLIFAALTSTLTTDAPRVFSPSPGSIIRIALK